MPDNTELLNKLKEQALSCEKCELCKTRNKVVFGMGVPTAEVVFIGEGPGANEDEQGLPFVGRSGQFLDKMFAYIDLYRDKNIYICNMVKCRPPENRDPLPEEQEACRDYLKKQLELINPKIIVCLGRIAAKRFIKDDFKVTAEHGAWFRDDAGRFVMGTFHPAAILRNPNQRPAMMEDFFALRDKINEICEHTY